MLQRPLTRFALLFLFLAALIWLFLRGEGTIPPARPDAGVLESVSAQDPLPAKASPAPADADGSTGPLRAEVVDPAPEAEAAAAALVIIRGRCVAAENGTPLAGCEVGILGWSQNSSVVALAGGGPRSFEPDPVLTGEDGRFEFRFEADLAMQFVVDAVHEGRVRKGGRWSEELVAGTVLELGDVPLGIGVRVSGTVKGSGGEKIADAEVSLGGIPMELEQSGGGAGDSVGAIADAEGNFVFAHAVPAGTWEVRLRTPGFIQDGPESFTIPEGVKEAVLEVTATPAEWIEGICVDEAGVPVVRAEVDADRIGRFGGGWIEADRTDREGRFQIQRRNEGNQPVQLNVHGGGCEPYRGEESFAWGSKDIRIVLRRASSALLTVVRMDTGEPVTEYALIACRKESNSSLDTEVRLPGSHPEGKVKVTNLSVGANLLLVIPHDPTLAASEVVEFQIDAGLQPELRVEVEPLEPIQVKLQEASGAALAGSTIYVGRGEERWGVEEWAFRWAKHGRSGTSVSEPGSYSDAKSGADGIASLYAPRSDGALTIAAFGEHPAIVKTFERAWSEPQPLILTIPSRGAVQGRMIHPLCGTGEVAVRIMGGSRRMFGWSSEGVNPEDLSFPDTQGAFRFTELDPGEYSLGFAARRPGSEPARFDSLDPDLAEFTLESGEIEELVLDASAFAPGSLSVTLRLDGVPAAGARFALLRMTPDRPFFPMRTGELTADAAGRCEIPSLPAGDYGLELLFGERQPYRALAWGGTAKVQAGVTLNVAADFVHRILRVRLIDHRDGAPIRNASYQVQGGSRFEFSFGTVTDAEGWVVLDPAPLGKVSIQVVAAGGVWLRTESVEAAPDRKTTELEARTLEPKEEQDQAVLDFFQGLTDE